MIKNILKVCFLLFSTNNLIAQCPLYGVKEYYNSEGLFESSQLVQVDEHSGSWSPLGPKYPVEVTDYANLHYDNKGVKYISLNYQEAKLHSFNATTGTLTTLDVYIDEDEYLGEVVHDYEAGILYGVTSLGRIVTIDTEVGKVTENGQIPNFVGQDLDPYTSLYDRVSKKLFIIGLSRYTEEYGGYTIFIVDPKDPEVADTLNVSNQSLLFADKTNGAIYSAFLDNDLIRISELNRVSRKFENYLNLPDEFSISSTGGSITFNQQTKSLVITGITTFEEEEYNGFYIINLKSGNYEKKILNYTEDVVGFLYGECNDIISGGIMDRNKKIMYENPVSDQLEITLNEQDSGQIKLFNSDGGVLGEYEFNGESVIIATNNLNPGVYHFEIQSKKGLYANERIIVIK